MTTLAFRGLAAAVGLVVTCAAGAASADTLKLNVGDRLARADLLQPGVHRYVRYIIKGEDRTAIDVWVRTLSFADHDGVRAMHIVQRWTYADNRALDQDSWFEAGTFRPTSHVRRATKEGKTLVLGYQWTASKVSGMPDLADNAGKDFVMPLAEPAYNFEYDMEFLQALPMAVGRTFDIPFYDAGIDKKADRYQFTVAGAAVIAGPDGKPMDCWVVTAEYHTGKVVSRFWFAKRDQLLVREEGAAPDGRIIVKALLPPESGDEASKKI